MQVNTLESIYDRFTRTESGCLVWNLSKTHNGYGLCGYQGRQWRVHRLIWTLLKGPIPPGAKVCHRCDNPPCSEIAHLFLGTQLDNIRDMYAKGREPRTKGKYERSTEWREASRSRNMRRSDAKYGPGVVRVGDPTPLPVRVPKSMPTGTPLLPKACTACGRPFLAPATLMARYKACSRECSASLRRRARTAVLASTQ